MRRWNSSARNPLDQPVEAILKDGGSLKAGTLLSFDGGSNESSTTQFLRLARTSIGPSAGSAGACSNR
jgi:hypothetical protein